jgi:outer membrane protein assembly factor BamE (lipoprotein component of BamABCDE complex)
VLSHTALNRIIVLTASGALAFAILVFWISSYSERRVYHAFEQIKIGSTRQQVVALLGVPDTVRGCGDSTWWGDDLTISEKNDGRCVTETRYEHFLNTLGVGYSQDGRVVSKYHYSSE